jgi:hypothetical protein
MPNRLHKPTLHPISRSEGILRLRPIPPLPLSSGALRAKWTAIAFNLSSARSKYAMVAAGS